MNAPDHDEYDPNEAFADPAACGLASALLLLLAVLLNRAAGTGNMPAITSINVSIEFLQAPAKPFEVSVAMNKEKLFAVKAGVMQPGRVFAREANTRKIDLFDKQSAFFRTAQGERMAISLSTDILRQQIGLNTLKPAHWNISLTVQFPKKAFPLNFEWKFGAGAKVKAIVVEANSLGADRVPPKQILGGENVRFVISGNDILVNY